MSKHTLVATVEEGPVVLNRVLSLFRQRSFAIESLSIGRTNEPGIMRLTMVVDGARSAVDHLIAAGRRTIATITGPQDMTAGIDRQAGYERALRAAGREPDASLVEPGEFTQESGVRAMQELLRRCPDLDAVFVASDLMASGALRVLRAAGRRVPADVAVVGFDDSPIALTAQPPLTSVRQSPEVMGRELVELLFGRIEARDRVIRKVVLATELIVRESSGG